jgi:hypothetical protein
MLLSFAMTLRYFLRPRQEADRLEKAIARRWSKACAPPTSCSRASRKVDRAIVKADVDILDAALDTDPEGTKYGLSVAVAGATGRTARKS